MSRRGILSKLSSPRDMPNGDQQRLSLLFFAVFVLSLAAGIFHLSDRLAWRYLVAAGVMLFLTIRYWNVGIDFEDDSFRAVGKYSTRTLRWQDIASIEAKGRYVLGARLKSGEWVVVQRFFWNSWRRDQAELKLNQLLKQNHA